MSPENIYSISSQSTHTITKQILLCLLGICVGLVLSEYALRIFAPSVINTYALQKYMDEERGKFAEYSSTLGWDGIPNVDEEFIWLDCKHQVTQNKYGYRGKAYGYERSSKRRVVFLGDSFLWGFGVNNDEMFTALLEKSDGIEAVNLGVSGFGNDQQLIQWRLKGKNWDPDHVVLMFSPVSDVFENTLTEMYDCPKPAFDWDKQGQLHLINYPVPKKNEQWSKQPRRTGVRHLHYHKLYTVITKSALATAMVEFLSGFDNVRDYLESSKMIPKRQSGWTWEFHLYAESRNEQVKEGWRYVSRIIGMLDSHVKEEGAKLTVVMIPSLVQVYPELWEEIVKDASSDGFEKLNPDAPNDQIRRICKDYNIDYIDLTPEMKRRSGSHRNMYYPFNMHWTRDGHKIAAEILSGKFTGI